jgi:AraC-like DNA-binding protein
MDSFGQSDRATALLGYPLFRSNDLEQTRDAVADLFCPHDLKVTAPKQRLEARMHHASLDTISVSRINYGADVTIDRGYLDGILLIHKPLTGAAEISCGKHTQFSRPDLATVINPKLPLRIRRHGNCDSLIVRIPSDEIARQCAQHLGHSLSEPIEFQMPMDICRGGGQDWWRLVTALVGALDQEDSTLRSSPLGRAQLVQTLLTALLLCQPHNYRDRLLRPGPPLAPRFVKRVEEYIEAHADQPITVTDMARHADVSTRSLYAGFRNFRSTSPTAHLRAVRLQRAHDDLLTADENDNVTAIATRWGFTHLSNFTAIYKRRFGECPSVTLRRWSKTTSASSRRS